MKKFLRTGITVFASAVVALVLGSAQTASSADNDWKSPFVAIVWPHNGSGTYTPVASSKAVNVSVWPSNAVSCSATPSQTISLWQAKNNEPAAPVGKTGEMTLRNQDNKKFPSIEFNNVAADIASNNNNRFYFMMGDWKGNIWVDAVDARTYLPNPLEPNGISDKSAPAQIDARIQIVYPHDKAGNLAPLNKATLDNVAVDLFEHGTKKSVPLDYNGGKIVLYMAEANYPMGLAQSESGGNTVVAVAHLEPYKIGAATYPRWVFNDVKVQPGKQYHFMVRVEGVETFPTVWTHAEDPRTYLPNPQTPPACTGGGDPQPQTCSTPWFTKGTADGACPTGEAKQAEAAWEPFQKGIMIWRKGSGFDILRTDKNTWEGWRENLKICRDTSANVKPPKKLFAPVSGFGYIWRGDADYCTYSNPDDFDHDHFKKVLGWATAPEAGYTATFQSGSKKEQGEKKVLYTYISLPDGRVVELSTINGSNQTTVRIFKP